MNGAGWRSMRVRVGPLDYLLRAERPRDLDATVRLYRDYPKPDADAVVDYSVAVVPDRGLRRWLRPRLYLHCDVEMDDMAPSAPHLAPLAFEMGMNLQAVAGLSRLMVIHAGSAARDGRGLLLIGDSGAGKSTLSATLAYSTRGWRFMGDELALLGAPEPLLHPFPRPISLKNHAIDVMEALAPADRFGPRLENTVKGTIRHLLPPTAALDAMHETAVPAMVLAPRFKAGVEPHARRMSHAEAFVRISQSSPNAGRQGEAGFEALMTLIATAPAYEIHYGSTGAGLDLVDRLWREAGLG